MSEPTVSVILPVYNGENYLRLSVESVLGQTFRDFELIVIDDGSKDSTPEIARSYGERLRYVRQENTGVAGAFNHGLRLAAGRYISWLSHDDVFLPAKLEKQVGAISQAATPSVCYTDVQMIGPEGNIITEHRLPEHGRDEVLRNVLTIGPVCMASYSILYDRRCIDEIGMYSVKLRYAQDIDMLARLAQRFPLIHVPEVLMQVREHEQRAIHSKSWAREVVRFFRERLDALPIEELYPELGANASGNERSEAYMKLADAFANQPFPLYRVAFSPYRRALRENPANAAKLLRRMARLYRLDLRRRLG